MGQLIVLTGLRGSRGLGLSGLHIGEFFRRSGSFIQRFGWRNAVVEAVRRLGLNALCKQVLTRRYSVKSAWKAIDSVAPEETAHSKVSIILPVCNGIADGLEQLLVSLDRQTHANRELVAVDSGSTDDSIALLERYGAKVIRIPKSDFRHDYARNLGAENATGDYLLFTVCDCRFSDPRWIEVGLRQMKRWNAMSYSTPQAYDAAAEPYARYLGFNFLSANQYKLGANLFGNGALGSLAFGLAGHKIRERAVHVDDTNHLVRRDFFLQHRYHSHTCEDMDFGARLIRSGSRFLFSTLSHVQHYHAYNNYKKYFTRVLVDAMAIKSFLSPYEPKRSFDPVDLTVNSGSVVLGLLFQVLQYYEETDVQRIVLQEGASLRKRLHKEESIEFEDLKRALCAKDVTAFSLDVRPLVEAASPILADQIGLALDPSGGRLDFYQLVNFRDYYINHLRVACEILGKLGYAEMPLAEFRHFAVLCLVNQLAAELSFWAKRDLNGRSANAAFLAQLKWM